ncbi:PD40 domain-containing protein [Hymenobacter gummosus]|uniref:PD40 domain-containing protein n=1 Tax=Hymenobacter gummosus TaxID=1776032 RepID=UPI0014053ED4|nr:PD40 domain-containing protein [Hymenobacter gummosus]
MLDYPLVESVKYNPNDANEVAYVLTEESAPGNVMGSSLYKMNLFTKQRTLLASDVSFTFDWGRNGWLLFTSVGSDVWKIKANGDSLTRLTTTTGTGYPVWSPDGSRIVHKFIGTTYARTGVYVRTATGQQLQFIPDARILSSNSLALAPDNRTLALGSGLGYSYPSDSVAFGLYDLSTLTFRPLLRVPRYEPPIGILWTPDGQRIIWSDRSVKELEVATGRMRVVRAACAPDAYGRLGRWFLYPSLSPDGQRLAMVTCGRYLAADGKVHVYTKIQTTDRNGQHIRDVTF